MSDKTKKTETKSSEETKKTAPTPPVNEEETVPVKKATLEAVLDRVKGMEDNIAKLKEENERLASTADVGRLHKWDSEHQKELIRTARVGLWRDDKDVDEDGIAKQKMILGWRTVKDEVLFSSGVIKEIQIVRLFLDEGPGEKPSECEVNYVDWYRNMERRTGSIIKESKTPEGETRTLEFPDGRQLEMDIRFLNV